LDRIEFSASYRVAILRTADCRIVSALKKPVTAVTRTAINETEAFRRTFGERGSDEVVAPRLESTVGRREIHVC